MGNINISHCNLNDTSIACSGYGQATSSCRINYTFLTNLAYISARFGTTYITNTILFRTTSTNAIYVHSSVIMENVTISEGSGTTAINFLQSGNILSKSKISGNFTSLINNQGAVVTIDSSIIGPNSIGKGFTGLSGTTYFYDTLVCFFLLVLSLAKI